MLGELGIAAGWAWEPISGHLHEKIVTQQSVLQGSLKSAYAGQGQALFSRSQRVNCTVHVFVHHLPCWTIFLFAFPMPTQGLAHRGHRRG